ncbi:MAG: protein-glutamate O-methyltransferase [Myxococcota bacterium]
MSSEVREFKFTTGDFQRLARIVRETSGIALTPAKRDLVYSRLAKRVRAFGFKSFSQYADLLDSGDQAELVELTNAMTTNVTSFLRESYHFDHLCDEILPGLIAGRSSGQRIRIWSAACSTGEEPYSIALSALARVPNVAQHDFRILATDLDSQVVERGRNGVYEASSVEALPKEWQRRYFQRGRGASSGRFRVKPEVRDLIAFKTLNLMQPWPVKGPFDAIFCRNVMIYFDDETRARLVERFRQLLKIGGFLFIGHSESLPAQVQGFDFMKRTTYRRAV